MKIEKWLDDQNFTQEVAELFREGNRCYKASAYRAALLFSYLGFLNILKERILKSQVPTGIPEPLWNKIQTDAQKEDSWDKTVFEATQRKDPACIFIISDSIRQGVLYWKNRRNDCAHLKTESIDFFHVESFWAFLETNLPKFMVNGSRDALLNKIEIHFNPSYTAPGQDFTHLVKEIEHAVEVSDLVHFYQGVKGKIESLHTFSLTTPIELLDFFDAILAYYSNFVSNRLIKFLKDDKVLMLTFLREHPNRLTQFELEPPFIRFLWYEKLFDSHENDFPIYCAMLRNRLIPPDDISKANERIIGRNIFHLPSEHEKMILDENRFFETLRELAFSNLWIDVFKWANNRAEIIAYLIYNYPLDKETVKAISSVFSSPNHPWKLRDKLNYIFSENLGKKSEFLEIAKAEQINLPDQLNSLTED